MNKVARHIIIMGAPGCGKGTQAQKLVQKFGFLHLSTGELFRKKYANKNEEAKQGKASIDKGGFFSDEIAYQIIRDFISENANARGIVFDGFPRDSKQASYFLEHISAVPIVIELKADEDKLLQRLLNRGKQIHREDDSSVEIIRRRLALYHELTVPVIEFFREKKFLHAISGEGEIDEVAFRIEKLLNTIA